ncbi:NAD-dependent epimerase/dehydratase [Paracidovorax avenae ATCC 19860]|uniref:NAD-dependent epimerase/dehydratase n=1 Tax=Paracidovorax avenae (strain ATCC 19860 / DSM 7227 / CCUG 15838 / JCM 20985 / LMG 2117 / NCPPB 1011) TaxID=643561 RepID=F0Q8D0_PARA1|nr:DoxX-like family protein [Paracidovorax avenae]ADX47128.1 NAD-dependent epimerase/dehydratase [Paracidovorax avenae ATCC 19860]AVS78453.1 epimerase [Paracidovorax avenae]
MTGRAPPSSAGPRERGWLRASLVAVWLGTAVASVAEFHGQSRDLLVAAGMQNTLLMQAIIAAGIAADLAVGAWLWWRPGRPAYAAALLLMGAMTVIATLLLPGLWLDPLGRLLKNIPIAAILLVLWHTEERRP